MGRTACTEPRCLYKGAQQICVHSSHDLTRWQRVVRFVVWPLGCSLSWGKTYKLSQNENCVEDSGLLGCDAVWLGKQSKRNAWWHLRCWQNVRNYAQQHTISSSLKNCVLSITALTARVSSQWTATVITNPYIAVDFYHVFIIRLHEKLQLKIEFVIMWPKKMGNFFLAMYSTIMPAHVRGPAGRKVHTFNTNNVTTSYNMPVNPF
jgi:hypothetical protein